VGSFPSEGVGGVMQISYNSTIEISPMFFRKINNFRGKPPRFSNAAVFSEIIFL
jgi:hypothetical protein